MNLQVGKAYRTRRKFVAVVLSEIVTATGKEFVVVLNEPDGQSMEVYPASGKYLTGEQSSYGDLVEEIK